MNTLYLCTTGLSISITPGHWCRKWRKVKPTHRPRIDTDKLFRISQIRNFKEFYWNKDKFQSQSLIVFKSVLRWLCASNLWLFFKTLFCLISIFVYKQRNKRGRDGKTRHNRRFLAQPTHTTGYSHTLFSPSERQVLAELLLHNGLLQQRDSSEIQ